MPCRRWVQGRSIRSADDVAALLHGRVTKWLESAGGRRQPDRIVGLWPAFRVTDPDMVTALQDRRRLIEQRARSLALNALEYGQPWVLKLGRPPAEPARREEWLRRLDTVAAYRERWQVNAGAVLGGEPRSHEQTAHQQSAQHAASTALAIAHTADLARDMCANDGHRTQKPLIRTTDLWPSVATCGNHCAATRSVFSSCGRLWPVVVACRQKMWRKGCVAATTRPPATGYVGVSRLGVAQRQ